MREFNAISIRCRGDEERKNYRVALLCSVVANSTRDSKRKPNPYKPEDFLPDKDMRGHVQTGQQILSTVVMLNAAFGGDVKEV